MDQTNPANKGQNCPFGTEEEIKERFDKAYERTCNTPEIADIIKHILPGKHRDVQHDRARALALYLEVIELRRDSERRFPLTTIHRCLTWYSIRKPNLGSYNRFEEFVNRGPGKSRDLLIEFLRDVPRGVGNGKIGGVLEGWILKLYFNPTQIHCERVAEVINDSIRDEVTTNGIDAAISKFCLPNPSRARRVLESGRDFVSSSSVKRLVRKHKNELFSLRYGTKAGRELLSRPLRRIKPLNPLDRVEIDCTVFSYVQTDDNHTSIRMVTCCVRDCYSGKIIGIAFDKSESASLYMTAMKNAFNEHLPAEIFTDRFPGYNNKTIEELIGNIRKLGCHFIIERSGNPMPKGSIEKSFDVLCTMAMEDGNFIGKNITTKNRDSRKSVEAKRKMMLRSNLRSGDAVRAQIVSLVAYYNSKCEKGESVSRFDKFNKSPKPNSIPLQLEQRVWLWHKSKRKQVERGGVIVFYTNGAERKYFEILDHNVRLRYLNHEVIVRYEDETMDHDGGEIYLFDPTTDQLICSCKEQRRAHMAKVNQDQGDIEIIEQHKESNREFKKRIDSAAELVNALDIEVVDELNASKDKRMQAEALYELQSMVDKNARQSSDLQTVNIGEEKKEILMYRKHTHRKQSNEEIVDPKLDRLRGFYESDPDEVAPVMNINQ